MAKTNGNGNGNGNNDDDMGLPADASLNPPEDGGVVWCLKTGGAVIPMTKKTAIHRSTMARCILVGRQAKTVDLRVDHGSISRKHAALFFTGDKANLVVKDLGSKKGTQVNGTLIPKNQHLVLKEGDEIVFGHARERVFKVIKGEEVETEETKGESTTDSTQEQHPIEKILQDHELPIRERMTLTAAESERRHRVTCLSCDTSGNRLVVGTTDGTLRFYDFGGMDTRVNGPFKMIAVEEGQAVSDVCFSNTGDRILVGTAGAQPYVLDRDGGEIIKFVRGDMYVIDKSKTNGHTAEVTGVQWHPYERDTVLTCSTDGCIRLWNLNAKTQFQMLTSNTVYAPKSLKGQRTQVQCLAIHPAGREFAIGTSCGSIQIWNTQSGNRPVRAVYGAHDDANNNNSAVDAIAYSANGQLLASRSLGDANCHVWQANKLSKSSTPWATCQGAPTLFAGQCRPAFSPNARILSVGTSQKVKQQQRRQGDDNNNNNTTTTTETGGLQFYALPLTTTSNNTTTTLLDPLLELPISSTAAVTDMLWHAKTNQLYLGLSDGTVQALLDPNLSERGGALLAFGKAGRRPKGELAALLASRAPTGSAALVANHDIIAPNAVPHNNKRKRRRDEEDPSETLKPQAPGAKFRMGRLNNA